ncbi:urea transporter [Mucilaginibacter psychrotolerans]|uniref:urea transporter n=1 Tax=Mucilaginibacter psychrotolerans TaxID=1524096 RepID=UPI00130547AE|nr:urea transporter [Mucilaginibacter psychrotolerans]
MKKQTLLFIQALLNSYSIVFFSQDNVLAVLLLAVSFFDPLAGCAGLFSACFSLALLKLSGHRADTIQSGLYSFNSILLGIGFGSFYHFNAAFCLWLVVATILTVMLTVSLTTILAKRGLPALSLPFVIVFWMVLLAANGYAQLHLLPKESYLLNELSTVEHTNQYQLFTALNTIPLPFYVKLFFRAVSAILFQDSVFAGIVISVGVFIHSRISFSLLALGFTSACLLNAVVHVYPDGLGHYHLGVNFMMTSMALGGFFAVPSLRSYLLGIAIIPLAYLLTGAFTVLLDAWHLPILSLPFCIIVSGILYFLNLRQQPGKLQLVAYQNYSPEANLYQYLNGQERLHNLGYLNLSLPFMGSWMVSQGYEGGITHKAEWGQALDFVITNEDGQTYKYTGEVPADFYCYNKPVLACADGVVETVVNHIDDNPIGEVNTRENWGNTIVINHAPGLYSKVSHLKQGSAKVKPGDMVKRGDILALCGNSGRSPEPHLHFQMQATPYVGSKTMAYPFAYYLQDTGSGPAFNSFQTPPNGDKVSNIDTSPALKQAFTFQPGYVAKVASDNYTETWEVFTDTLNQTYIYEHQSGDIAYFISNDTAFYFTAFYGGRASLLYHFQLAAFKVIFNTEAAVTAQDIYPVNIAGSKAGLWLHDVLSPFYRFIRCNYQSRAKQTGNDIIVTSTGTNKKPGGEKQFMQAQIRITGNQISGFTIGLSGKKTEAVWQA